MAQNVIYFSLGIAGLIALACIMDVVSGMPFGGQTVMDIIFLLSAGLIVYLGVDALKGAGRK